ncbi:hypothetical protein GJAV_G00018060 [Gymnothorax javanicus]|nr:hypothetical protein GJAV_G00018060 [Gymnothorax javanicus]
MGVVVFILTVGGEFKYEQVWELASFPMEQHIVHLGDMKQGEQEYAQRFLRGFFYMLRSGINSYPPASIQRQCETVLVLTAQGEALKRKATDSVLVSSILEQQKDEQVEDMNLRWPGHSLESGVSKRSGTISHLQAPVLP